MKGAEKDMSDQMQQLIDTKEQDNTLKLFAGETYKSLTKASSENDLAVKPIRG